jgi:hypothetical protein
VYQRYTEGHETIDLVAARRLLDELNSELVAGIAHRMGSPAVGDSA